MNDKKSNCCNYKMIVDSSDYGTSFYRCVLCGCQCDPAIPKKETKHIAIQMAEEAINLKFKDKFRLSNDVNTSYGFTRDQLAHIIEMALNK